MAEFALGRIRFVWKGVWAPSTVYVKDDVVRNGGKTFICLVGHSSASSFYTDLEITPPKWEQVSDGSSWKNNWVISTSYNVNDIVKYGGKLYICNNNHTSAATSALGLEANQSDWDDFTFSFDWKTDWAVSTRYKVGDVVKYGGYVYVCNTGHTSAATSTLGLEADQAKWDFLQKGFDYLGTWSGSSVRYKINDIVKYGANLWICTTQHTSSATFAESNWTQFVEGLEFEDTWSSSTTYQPGDVVLYGGFTYVSKTNHSNQTPTTNSDDWDLFTTGFKFQGDWSSVTAYKVGDVVRLNGYTYVAKADNTNFSPPNNTYWNLLNSGFKWIGTWANATAYNLGDVVKHTDNSYICIQGHTSDNTTNRPDVDVTAQYWNLVAAGPEASVLSTSGDLLYFGGIGPARLPVGENGQILKVSNSLVPSWGYFGIIDQVYYVAPSGTDSPAPAWGTTLDKPWKTVRYAAEQIEKGPKNAHAARLLERNRVFIQKETTAWISAQISGNISPFTSAFTYNSTKCERDIGYIIDALVYDLRHGGNVRSRKVALEYTTNAGQVYVLGQKEETNAAINYALTVIDEVISNVTHTPLQGTVTQIIDLSLVEEIGAQSILNNLVSLMTSSITAGLPGSVPAEVRVNYTIFVKTGIFYETLPIIVPRDTAIVGDELRSTNIRPAGQTVQNSDVPYTLAALTRISNLISDIVQNIAITKSAGNTLTQDVSRPAGTSQAGTSAAQLMTDAINYINYHLNAVGSAPGVSGTNTPTDAQGYYNAALVLEENKNFIAEEAIAYINTTYPGYANSYNVELCKRDVRAFVDAAKYDLVYTGNYKTLLAAGYYRRAVTGSTTEHMFFVRNGTGLRNMTIQGLTGSLGSPNSYGTRRPTAGAYVSLDPGWGPADEEVWITNKSPYVQNVTTFGTACVGLKVDGSLHNGGNDSVVANDFTQILSDGIGAWVTNNARAELVSVFSYYGHIGYLAENGGKIRATNGNSSYGTYGCVSEGLDSTETAITAKVNNRAFHALATNVFTNGSNILRLEYLNAGVNYNNATFTFSGDGGGVSTVGNEFRDNGVFEVRVGEPDDSTSSGGLNYVTATNVAQSGNSTSITLAATDTALSTHYVGMRIIITSGTGVGQFGYIQAYNSGSKVATIYKESTGTAGWDHVIPGTDIASSLDLTTTYLIEPRVELDPPGFTASASTQQSASWTSLAYGDINATYTAVAASGGTGSNATFNVTKTGVKYSVVINNAGTGYTLGNTLTILGTSVGGSTPANDIIITITKVTSGVINNFDYSGQAAGGRFVAVASGGNATQYSSNGTTWTSGANLPTSGTWSSIVYGNYSGTGTWVAVRSGSDSTAYSTNGATSWTVGGTLPSSGTWSDIGFGNNNFMILGSGTNLAYISTDGGLNWSSAGTLPASTTWTSVAYGGGKWVAVASGGTQAASSINDGTSWVSRTLPSSASWSAVAYGNNRFVAVASNGTDTAYSLDGLTWKAGGALPNSNDWSNVSYGQGLFIAVAKGSTDVIATSEDGIIWTSRTLSTSSSWVGVAFGNPNSTPVWAAITTGTTTANSIVTGATAKARCKVVDQKISEFRIIEPGSGYTSAPTVTITDPNNTADVFAEVRVGKGVLANPTFSSRGTGYPVASVVISGNGTCDIYQPGTYIYVKNLTANPTPGSNIQFDGDSTYYKLVTVTQFLGTGPYTARLQISPPMSIFKAPAHDTAVTLKIKYSQVRLTGHDFLDIGTGNFADTNYPGIPVNPANAANETRERGGGRVFYTSTDQDGNFRVGTLFSVEQASGVATLNADAFNIAGLNELTLGAVSLGGSGATITEFSTDPLFTANSDSIVPTQKAIKAYISSQIGSGSSSLNVNTLTAGAVYVAGNTITTTNGNQLEVTSTMNFIGSVRGIPLALNFFLLG